MNGGADRQPEYRRNKVSGEWVIFAPGRAVRPRENSAAAENAHPPLPAYDAACPFCPGNERYLEGILLEMRVPGDDGWSARAVPNKFPAVLADAGTERVQVGIYLSMPAYGRHEVVIESPLHNDHPALMGRERLEAALEACHRRYFDLMGDPRNMWAVIFRNHGIGGGMSLLHPHSQIVATGVVPGRVRQRDESALYHFDRLGRCLFCEILAFEAAQGSRVVLENDDFLAFVPFASEVPFETWIVPKRHHADFGGIGDGEKAEFARILRELLQRLRARLGDPDYNYVIHSAARYRADEPHLHWYLQLLPRLTNPAGFEMGSGIRINPSLPEEDAAVLRNGTTP